MTAVPTTPVTAPDALASLAVLQELTLEAGLCADLPQLRFRMLNRAVAYCRYDRAVLWEPAGRGWRLTGVSGCSDVNQVAALASEWRRVVCGLPRLDEPTMVGPGGVVVNAAAWEPLARRTNGLSAVWLPIKVSGRTVAGMWLERWSGARFSTGDVTRLGALALAYGVAWRSVAPRHGVVRRWIRSRRALSGAGLCAGLAAVLAFVQAPLRIVAPCEVVPRDPWVVAAPLAGVIDEVHVLPGRSVTTGTRLASYDKRVALEELKVAQQQVQIIESDLQRARVQAFDRPGARAEITLLENRLAQEQTRLRIAEHRAGQLEITAPTAGTVMFADPNEWRGRPVQVGERLMLIVDPQQTKVRIWLPEHDNIAFDTQRPVSVLLDSDPGTSRPAKLEFLANHSQDSPAGVPSFRAEAAWERADPDLKVGLQGAAVLRGQDVPLGYWLLRRPLAAVRQWLGV